MPPIKGQMLKYSEAAMLAALEDCRSGMPTATAAKKHGVPRVTLLYKIRGKTPIPRKMGRRCYVSEDIEEILVTWVRTMAKSGFPVSRSQLQDSVKRVVEELQIVTPFTNKRPGKKWFQSFLKRHPELTIRTAQNLTSTRASVTNSQLKNWFYEVYAYLKDNQYETILDEPSRCFNMDETAFFLNPSGLKVLATKGDKTVYQQTNPDEKECLTVLLGGNAAGIVLPPMVVFKYERIPRELSLSIPPKWAIGRSESGWMTGETFFEYISNIFNPWLRENNICKPVILFIDGHTSHLTYHLSKFCSENGIILVALYPNATHLIQPMDVAVFRSLKQSWKEAVQKWRQEHLESPILRKVNFSPLLKEVIEGSLKPEILQNGFRKCGIIPWNPDLPGKDVEAALPIVVSLLKSEISELETGMKVIEKYVGSQKIETFKSCSEWQGSTEDTSLFVLYNKIKTILREKKEHINITESRGGHTPVSNTKDDEVLREPDSIGLENTVLVNEIGTTVNIQPESTDNRQINDEPNLDRSEANMPIQIHQDPETPRKDVENVPASSKTIIEPVNESLPSTSFIIPSPFKRALFWSTPKENATKKRKKEKIPAVISSSVWQNYHEDKESKKKSLEEEKKKKAEERKIKRQLQEEIKKQKQLARANQIKKVVKKKRVSSDSSTEEEWIQSDSTGEIEEENTSENETINIHSAPEPYKEGDYVLVKFPGKKKFHKYLCIIQNIFEKDGDLEVMAMIPCDSTKTLFKENECDISVISNSQIIKCLSPPNIVISGDRIEYKFAHPIDVDK